MVIDVSGVSKTIGSKIIINNVSLKINKGQVYALLGPNGAGKTTTLRILAGEDRTRARLGATWPIP